MAFHYYVASGFAAGGEFLLEGAAARHIALSARHRPGEHIKLFDGKGAAALAVITSAAGGRVTVRVIKNITTPPPCVPAELFFALVSREAVEDILDKCTQLGITAFRPIITARTVSSLAAKWRGKSERFAQITVSACEQSGRALLPEISEPVAFAASLSAGAPALFLDTQTGAPDFRAGLEKLKKSSAIRLYIGPEGGFTAEESALAAKSGALAVSLGPRILRAETACAAAAALLGL